MTIREYDIICPRCDQDFRLLVDHAEANQRNAESGTTACSAAGGGVEQVKTAGSAGREPLREYMEWLGKEIDRTESKLDGLWHKRRLVELITLRRCYSELIRIEERR